MNATLNLLLMQTAIINAQRNTAPPSRPADPPAPVHRPEQARTEVEKHMPLKSTYDPALTANKSAYWTPVLVDGKTGKPVYYKSDDPIPGANDHFHQFFGNSTTSNLVAVPPAGLRMIGSPGESHHADWVQSGPPWVYKNETPGMSLHDWQLSKGGVTPVFAPELAIVIVLCGLIAGWVKRHLVLRDALQREQESADRYPAQECDSCGATIPAHHERCTYCWSPRT